MNNSSSSRANPELVLNRGRRIEGAEIGRGGGSPEAEAEEDDGDGDARRYQSSR